MMKMDKSQITIRHAFPKDAEEILALQKIAYLSEAKIYNNFALPPLTQTLEQILDDFKNYTVLKAVSGGIIVGSVRGQLNNDGSVYIGRLMVHPDFQNNGTGTKLMNAIEAAFPRAKKFVLGTGHLSKRNLHLYHKLGYIDVSSEPVDNYLMVHMEKTKN